MRRLVFRAWFGAAKNVKIGVSPRPYAHFQGFKGSKIHSKNLPKTAQNVKKCELKSSCFFAWGKIGFWHHFGTKNDPQNHQNVAQDLSNHWDLPLFFALFSFSRRDLKNPMGVKPKPKGCQAKPEGCQALGPHFGAFGAHFGFQNCSKILLCCS